MKKLNFILNNDNNIVCNEICDYSINQEVHSFKFGEYVISFKNTNDYFFFKRESSDSEFVIEYNNDKVNGYIYLKDHNIKMSIDVDAVDYKFEQNKVLFSYKIISDEDVIKTIIISFIN